MPNPMIPRERSEYSAIVDRPPLKLPGNARIVFWTIVNYEVWDIGKPMARQLLPAPTGVPLMPDVVHWGFHEYGMRVGCWRFFELFKKLGIKPNSTLALVGALCVFVPQVVGARGPSASAPPTWSPPPAGAGVDYQIGGDYPLPEGVTVVARDWFAGSAPEDAYSICYINAFQTQDDEHDVDRPDERSAWSHPRRPSRVTRDSEPRSAAGRAPSTARTSRR